jgi:hypothetical protein
MSETRLYENRPYGSYGGAAFVPGFLCGRPGMRQEWALSRRVLLAGSSLARGST